MSMCSPDFLFSLSLGSCPSRESTFSRSYSLALSWASTQVEGLLSKASTAVNEAGKLLSHGFQSWDRHSSRKEPHHPTALLLIIKAVLEFHLLILLLYVSTGKTWIG